MSARKPPGLGWESWIDRQVREATERGEFDDLAGAGQPLPDLDKPFDELWWVKNKLSQEGLTYMSPSVALRKEAHHARYMASPLARRKRHDGSSTPSTGRSARRTEPGSPDRR